MRDMSKTQVPLDNFSVVEYNTARKVFYELSMSCRREGDRLLVFSDRGNSGTSFYADKSMKEDDAIARLYIDEGYYSECLIGSKTEHCNQPWTELLDGQAFLGAIVRKLVPDFKPEGCNFMGHGRTQGHYIAQWNKALKDVEHDRVEFTPKRP